MTPSAGAAFPRGRTAAGPATVELSARAREFVLLSVRLTGFGPFDLYATGMADLYLATAEQQIGVRPFADFLDAWRAAGHPALLADPVHLEIARALAYLWYTGAWPRLAPAAHAALRREVPNTEFVVSPESYVEGLVWRTFHGHPAGAKPPGFATWSIPPPPLPRTDDLLAETERDLEEAGTAGSAVPADAPAGEENVAAPDTFDVFADDLVALVPGPGWAWFEDPSIHPTAGAALDSAANGSAPEEGAP